MNVSIIGCGYVGLVTGVCLAELGHTVIGVDVDKNKIEFINNGHPPIYEDTLPELLLKNLKNKKFTAIVDLKNALSSSDFVFVCVGTPQLDSGETNLEFITSAFTSLSEGLKARKIPLAIIIKSTVPPGTNNLMLSLLEKKSGKKEGVDFYLLSNPEFLREGKAIYDFFNPDKIVIGARNNNALELLKNLYSGLPGKIIETDPKTAEMIKYANNAFLATKISFSNEIGNICKKFNVDSYKVMDAIGLDQRIGRAFLDSGIGFGGSCFPKDVKSLIHTSKKVKYEPKLLESVVELNEKQPLKIIELLKKHIPNLKGRTIGVLGLAFKPDTDDIREAPSIKIVDALLKEGSKIVVYDPKAMDNFKKLYPQIKYTTAEEAIRSEAVLILTEWKEFESLNYKGKIVIAGRRIKKAREAKTYEGICW